MAITVNGQRFTVSDKEAPMEVILRDHVENVGKRGEVVKVADGYARNYLLPRKLALVATPGNLKQVERERVKLDQKEAQEKTAAEAIAGRMSNLEIVISRKVGESEVLYGSVTSADIAEALATHGFEIDKRKIVLREPIKKLGDVAVPVKLHRDVVVQVPVKVVAEGKPEAAPAGLPVAAPAEQS
jgi:large subunit ribosomal protein L9